MKHHSRSVLVLSLAVLGACAGRQGEPTIASSAEQTSYVLGYADQLSATTTSLGDEQTEVARVSGELKTRTQNLKGDVDPQLLLQIVELSEEAGKGRAFADARGSELAVRDFFEDERQPLTGRVSTAAQNKVTEASCTQEIDLGGSVSYALKDGVDKQLEKRLREHNDAQLLIQRHKASLGPANVALLETLADDIARASYFVNIALLDDKNRLERMLSEKRSVESTIDEAIETEQTFQTTQAKNEADKRASQERIAELTRSKEAIPAAVQSAEQAKQGLDEKIKKASADYDAALDALKTEIERKDPESGQV
jgi:hypothetical protein